jgi:hypothetical protein
MVCWRSYVPVGPLVPAAYPERTATAGHAAAGADAAGRSGVRE